MTRIPLYLIKKELEECGMTVEEMEEASRNIKTTLVNLSRSFSGLKCPNCKTSNLSIVLSPMKGVGSSGYTYTNVVARCGFCGLKDEFELGEAYSMRGTAMHLSAVSDLHDRFRAGKVRETGVQWDRDKETNAFLWQFMKKGGVRESRNLRQLGRVERLSPKGVLVRLLRDPRYSRIIVKKMRDLDFNSKIEFMKNLDFMGDTKAIKFLTGVKEGRVGASSTRPRGRPKRRRGRPRRAVGGPIRSKAWLKKAEDDLDIMEGEVERIENEFITSYKQRFYTTKDWDDPLNAGAIWDGFHYWLRSFQKAKYQAASEGSQLVEVVFHTSDLEHADHEYTENGDLIINDRSAGDWLFESIKEVN